MKQREIKFRGWHSELKIFFYYLPQDGGCWITNNDGGLITCSYDLSKYELMQFTGLKDKNGKEIYEGDRVLMKKGFDGIVKYHFQRAGFLIEYQQPPLRANYVAEFNVTYGDGETYMDDTLEIIGNVHEGTAVKAVEK